MNYCAEMIKWEERTVDQNRAGLIVEMRRFADRLTDVADRMDADPTRMPNSLGEVQSRGAMIDNLIGQLTAQTAALKTLKRYAEEAAKGGA